MSRTKAEEPQDAIPDPSDPGALSPKQELALRAVVAHPTLKEAALAAGVSDATLWRYMQEETFARRLREARREAVSHAVLQLQGAASDAVKTLQDIMKDASAGASARITAARIILEQTLRTRETEDVKARLEEL